MRLYLRSRKAAGILGLMCALAALNALFGGRLLTLTDSGSPVQMPYRSILTLFIAAAAVASLGSPAPQTDRGDTGPLRLMRRVHLASLLAVAVTLSAVSEVFTSSGEPLQAARACIGWYGLAMLSGGLLREAMSWVLPLVMMFVLVWWGAPAGEPESWNWATAPADQTMSWVVAVVSLALGGFWFLRR